MDFTALYCAECAMSLHMNCLYICYFTAYMFAGVMQIAVSCGRAQVAVLWHHHVTIIFKACLQ